MSSTNKLNGFRRSRKFGSNANSAGMSKYPVKTNAPAAIFAGDPVMLSAGKLRGAFTSTDRIVGIAQGFTYIDKTSKQPVWTPYLAANTSASDGVITALVDDDVFATYVVQADASLSAGDLGLNFSIRYGGGNTVLGRSSVGLDASTRTATSGAGKGAVKVVGLYEEPGNAWGDAYTKAEVRILNNLVFVSGRQV